MSDGHIIPKGAARILGIDIEKRAGSEDGPDFRTELSELLNKYSKENNSDTPDFILRDYLCDCLKAFDSATRARRDWYA